MKTLLFFAIIGISFFSISQNQITWGTTSDISASSAFGNNFPRIVMDRSGDPVVSWSNDTDMFFSRWIGTGFSVPIKINPIGITIAGPGWMGPDIASFGDTLYAVYKATPEMDTSSHVWCVSSFDGGLTFNTPIRVDNIFDSISRFPTVTVDNAGNPIVGFMKFDPNMGNARWVVAKSTNMGASFSSDILASGWSSPTSEVCDCCPSKIISNGNVVAMPYRDNKSNIRDTWVGLSQDGGMTFPTGMDVDQQNWMIMSCPSSGPDAVIVGDTLYTTYMSGASGSPLVSYSKFSISAMSSAMAIPLDQSPVSLVSQNFPRIDYNGGAMAFVWKQFSNGTEELAIQFTENITNGMNPNQEIVDTDNVNAVDVALFDGTIWVVWDDEASGTVKYRSGTYTSNLGYDNNSLPSQFIVNPNPATDQWNISGDWEGQEITLELINVFGEVVYTQKHADIESSKEITISCTNYKQGIYFLNIVSGSDRKVIKLEKL